MNWSASVLTSISSDTEPTVVVNFDTAKYIFNAGENTNRAFFQSRHNWKRTKALFVTQSGTQRASGLAGLLMTFADGGINLLDLVGPVGFRHQLASMRMYTFRDTLSVQVTEAVSDTIPSQVPIFKDENVTIYGIPITPPLSSQDDSLSQTHESACSEKTSLKRKRSQSPEHSSKRTAVSAFEDSLPSDDTLEQAMSRPRFSPTLLSGKLAQDWRNSMARIMFPGTRKHENEIAKEKKKEANHVRKGVKEKKTGNIGNIGEKNKFEELQPVAVSNAEQDAVPEPGHEPSTGNIDMYKRTHVPEGYHKQLPTFTHPDSGTTDSPSTLAYLVVGPRIRGRFDAKKAQELGIPNGPIRRRLINGETITFKTKERKMEGDTVREVEVERTVKPDECVGESETPAVILILDVPSTAYIPSLLSSFDDPFFAKFKSRSPEHTKEHVVRSVFHILGEGVLEDERYIQFMRSFEEGEDSDDPVHHMIASREHCPDPVTFTSAAFNQLRLNQLDERIFPVPKFSLQPSKDLSLISNLPRSTRQMASNHTISMRPFKAPTIETPAQDNFHPTVKTLEPVPLPPWTAKKFRRAKKSVEMALKKSKHRRSVEGSRSESESGSESDDRGLVTARVQGGKDVGVLPLGTGSAIPSKYRNVSSTLILIPGWGNVLLDAGEGTWGQLVRQFGLGRGPKANSDEKDVWQVLRDLKCIFISHVHADHHMGLATILAKRRLLDPPPKEPLYLVSIRAIHLYLRELSDVQNLGIIEDEAIVNHERKETDAPVSYTGVITIMSEALHFRQNDAYQTTGMWQIGGTEPWLDMHRSRRLVKDMCRSLGLASFQTVDMYHRTRCYGAVMRHQDGWSIAFSGDTLPVNNLVWAGKHATLLIHEATMADDQVDLAQKKAHSTFGQAITIGKKMNAEHILLTHFSARYPKMPPSAMGTVAPDDDPVVLEPKSEQIERGNADPRARRRRDPVIAVAFDHLNLTIGDMWKVNHYLPAIEQSFRDTIEEGDEEADESGTMEVDLT
ncbi:hypothetical protein AX17_001745 [Amanita inopinata Kibby_2008]|nr:hypothetical protein AX17_001745 [Amanita inopinata Kibby_2008]